jgi:hypothetical protein
MTGGAAGLLFPPPNINIAITIINIKNKQLQESPKRPPPAANAYFCVLSDGTVVDMVACSIRSGAGEV